MAEDGNNKSVHLSKKTVYLPVGIIESILSKLPAKSLLRFQTVSKSWSAMISNPAFVGTHLRHSKNSSSQTSLFVSKLKHRDREFRLVEFEGGKFQTVGELENPNPKAREVLCFCDGVILLLDPLDSSFVLWNPSTRANINFDLPYISLHMSYGICYGRRPVMDEFKVVIISPLDQIFAVFSCKNESWTRKKDFPFAQTDRISKSGIYFDGAIDWDKEDVKRIGREIFYFDPEDDELKIMQKPADLGDDNKPIFSTFLKGCLCCYSNGEDQTVVKIWIRKNDCWEELMSILNVQKHIRFFRPMFVVENTVLVRWIVKNLLYPENSRMLLYNTCENKFECSDEAAVFRHVLVPYVDTLFFPVESIGRKRKRNSVQSGSCSSEFSESN